MAETESGPLNKMTYLVFSIIFLFGGIEYSVILPTLWLYLRNTYNAPEYMLGFVLSAYSTAAFFSSPVIGRIVDRLQCPKQVFIVCACFELVGSFLYFIGISQWLCVASRFISGLGGAGEAIALAEVSRYSTEENRTSILSKLVAIRQLALLAAPGLNLVLRLADFNIGPFEVNKYSAPGAFMCVLWVLLIFLVLILFKNPSTQAFCDTKEVTTPNEVPEEDMNYDNPSAPLLVNDLTSPVSGTVNPSSHSYQSLNDTNAKEGGNSEDNVIRHASQVESPDFLGTSYDIMATAEFYMHPSDPECPTIVSDNFQDEDIYVDVNHFAPPSPTYRCPSIQTGKTQQTNEKYIVTATSPFDDPIQREGKLNFFCNEYIRDEIMAIVMLLFCAMFSQICMETMCTPLSDLYLDFGEVENSVIYCLSGAIVIVAFVMVSVLSKCVTDRNMILLGGVLLLVSNIWLIIFLPNAPKHNRQHNLPLFTVAVFIDVISLPFLFVCSTSLYSKLTRKETQGLSQGIRRSVVGLGTILGPLWASSAVTQLYLMLGVMIGIQSVSLLMCLLSYKRLKVPRPVTSTQNGTNPSTGDESKRISPTNAQSHASHGTSPDPESTSYGSIQKINI